MILLRDAETFENHFAESKSGSKKKVGVKKVGVKIMNHYFSLSEYKHLQ